MFNKQLFILAHTIGERSFYSNYKHLVKNQWRPYAELKEDQEKQLRYLISYAYENIPYYHTMFRELKLLPKDIHTIEDLQKLPILTKDIIKENWEEFKPFFLASLKYYPNATGGSTGIPLQYRLSKEDRFLGGALLYRGWGYGGYHLGDKMVFLAGSSLNIGTKSRFVIKAHERTRNIKYLSSFDMGEAEMRNYTEILSMKNSIFLRGYATSIFFYADWVAKNDCHVKTPSAIFTTAEKLHPNMRRKIIDVFGCEVYDNYGLNDGGVSAYECSEHAGLHIDAERSIMEIVDQNGNQVEEGQGKILATSLYNYSMPFIRYDTGDLASILHNECSCGRKSLLIGDIIGRENEFLITPEGRLVHGAALFNLVFYTIESSFLPDIVNKIKEFQIIQRKKEKIEIVFVCESELPTNVLDFIRYSIQKRFNDWDVEFIFVDRINRSRTGKFKFIVNELKTNV